MVRSVISGAGELLRAPSTAASMLECDCVRSGGASLGELGARAFAIDKTLGGPRGGSFCADCARARSSSTSLVRVICSERWGGSDQSSSPSAGSRRGGGRAVSTPWTGGPLRAFARAYSSTSNGGLIVGRSFSSPSGVSSTRLLGGSPIHASVRLRHHPFEHPVGPRETFDLALDRGDVALGDGLAGLGHDGARFLDGVAAEVARRDDVFDLREEALDFPDDPLGLLFGRLELLGRPPLDHIILRIFHHVTNLVARQAARRRDLDGLLLRRLEILRVNAHDAVGVDLEGHFDL